jgi:sulfite exporter TauE/SafE
VIDSGLVIMTGLLASLHCIGMCGPIVLAYSLQTGNGIIGKSTNILALHSAYNVGRIISYSLIGALFGLVGAAIGSFKNFTDYFAIFCGVLMVVAGLAMLRLFPLISSFSLSKVGAIFLKLHTIFLKRRTIGSKLSLGLLTPLLPCGILYAMFVKAASTGSFIKGGLTMALFGVGIAPSLILMGSFSSLISARFRKKAEMIAAITIILMGIILILRGFHVPYLKWLMAGNNSGNGTSCCH